MKTNEEKLAELVKLALPLNEWLHDNANPHTKIIIEQGSVEMLSGECAAPLPVRD